eukprot:TRINITY_DN2550_c0_g1_i1.p1 TRINITY_DN2550_c0_g1~~TRINITY_DN2550_c0_g1_i1.p1  ORF type:complete len:200 (+),score=21.54 TRINITY_DN2550_c0_g1_i1:123-722(+)
MASPLLLRGIPRLRIPLQRSGFFSRSAFGLLVSVDRAGFCAATDASQRSESLAAAASEADKTSAKIESPSFSRLEHPDHRRWKDKEDEILRDIEPTTFLTKEILHSDRYVDGERLTDEDEKFVVEKLLVYHPHSEDKIGCGLDSIMVDRHPQFRNSRCLFVIRTDGGWIDFSYQKCLRAYIRNKYPSHAERFIREHFKR